MATFDYATAGFPATPATGDFLVIGNVTYVYSAKGAWVVNSSSVVVDGGGGGGGGGGGWTEITSGTITSNTEALEFTDISTSYNTVKLYMTDINMNADSNYTTIQASNNSTFASLLQWNSYCYTAAYNNSTMVSGYGTDYTMPYISGGSHQQIHATSNHYQWSFILEIHDLQGIPFMTYNAVEPLDGARVAHAVAHGCADRIQSLRLASAYAPGRYFTRGTYKFYGME